jgi:hypothetical protein
MKRRTAAVVVLALLASVEFFAFPVDIRVGDSWDTVTRRLSLVPRIPCSPETAHENEIASRIFLLPDMRCVELVGWRKHDAEGTFVLQEIRVGPRFSGYPGRVRWYDDEFASGRSELSLSGYTFPRMICYASILTIVVVIGRSYRRLRRP